nr:MAG TPA: hypothetical protein [Caudoviricetes sp.]
MKILIIMITKIFNITHIHTIFQHPGIIVIEK